jgi:23S rRNA pseudouridine1911/1915/1917 synthase
MSLTVLWEDNHLLAVQKPAGMPSQRDQTGDPCMVDLATEYIRQKYKKPGNVYCALLHRLDRPVAGVLLLAKTGKAAARLSEQFQKGTVQKTYLALTNGTPPEAQGELFHYLRKLPTKNVVRWHNRPTDGAQEARLGYRVLGTQDGTTLLHIEPLTGRQHQIRVQCAAMGCPLLGDVKYGAKEPLGDRSIGLLAWQIQVQHPTTQETLTVHAQPPAQTWWQQMGSLFPQV